MKLQAVAQRPGSGKKRPNLRNDQLVLHSSACRASLFAVDMRPWFSSPVCKSDTLPRCMQ
jgi:hypothetical protein